MDWSLLITQSVNGLQLGLLLFLLSSGLTLIFGIMDFINLSHGSFYMIGAYVCGTIVAWSGSFFFGVIGGLIGVFVLGILVEQFIARKLYRRDHLDHLLITFGLILIFDTLVHMIWGAEGMAIPLPKVLNGQIEIGSLALPTYRLLIIASGLLVALFLYLLIAKTRLGMLIRAGASNRTMVEALGVDINRLFRYVFALGAALAGLAGLLIAPITEASIGMGNDIIILAFVVCIVGGIGSIKGAFYAAMFLGLMDTLSRSYLDTLLKMVMPGNYAETAAPAISAMMVYLLMAVVLAIRPQGLFPPAGVKS
jgi:branched-chain amino acid transport system permease protein